MKPEKTPFELNESQIAAVEALTHSYAILRESDVREKFMAAIRDAGGVNEIPFDSFAVTAALESNGWRDEDARTIFGMESLFELGGAIYTILSEEFTITKKHLISTFREQVRNFKSFFRYIVEGSLNTLPLLGQVAAIIVLKYSLWAWMEFTTEQATVVAFGTLLSFVVTGGFIQAIGREGVRYSNSGNHVLAFAVVRRLFTLGIATILASSVVALILNTLIPFYNNTLMLISLTYFILLSLLWLSTSVCYAIKEPLVIFIVTLAGIVPVHLVMTQTGWGIYAAHWLGLCVANALAYGYVYHHLGKKSRTASREQMTARLPYRPAWYYLMMPYFLYGMLYFTNLFIDRIISWSAPNPEVPPLVIWFRTPYELGMAWALLSFVLTTIPMEYTINRFWLRLPNILKHSSGLKPKYFITSFKNFYLNQLLLLVFFGVLSIIGTYLAVSSLRQFDDLQVVRDFFSNPVTTETFFIAAAGYFFLSLSLFHSLFFFTLSRPEFVLRSLLPAMVVNIIIGLLASRIISYEFGALGLLVGSIVFAAITISYGFRFFDKLDYYYYSAY